MISNELILSRYKNGIQLLPPDSCPEKTQLSVETIFKQPFSIYFVNEHYGLSKINSTCAANCQFDSESSAVGKIASDFLSKESAHFAVEADKIAMQDRTINILEHQLEHSNGIHYQYLTIKSPLYQEQKIVGIFGCSIVLGKHPLDKALQCISELGLLSSNMVHSGVNSLSKQQLAVAKLVINGLTAKEIGQQLGLSYRTVEFYLSHLKNKLGCQNKTDLLFKLKQLLDME
ncbi:LuxR family transcriptional regulator [Legionella santicrucis]|uniref:LuxR family transcriptional regulator n=1 Tax=Legionella santicrucis TaxID=45074 RepID=A0A0W0Y958_9GAMM|nr:helix-turn-helix transcriptional regulator [Legionella santicrucis]KTD53448.1 LuxR family transcriptional regulator [Legionella santicrucis]